MLLKKWGDLPKYMQNDAVREYYNMLTDKKLVLILKRLFDIVTALLLLVIISPIMLVISIAIAIDSRGEILYRQPRVTAYGKIFSIHKFRTMVSRQSRLSSLITIDKDIRITKVGAVLRRYRFDEFPQLLDVLAGNMTFVGTRPEIPEYVEKYSDEMKATLLLPAGITSETSIKFKDESKIFDSTKNIDELYINEVLPEKMHYNLKAIKNLSFFSDLKTMVKSIFYVYRKPRSVENYSFIQLQKSGSRFYS